MVLSQEFYDYLQSLEASEGGLNSYPHNSIEVKKLQILARAPEKRQYGGRGGAVNEKRVKMKLNLERVKELQGNRTGVEIDKLANKYKGWFTRWLGYGEMASEDIHTLSEVFGVPVSELVDSSEEQGTFYA